MNALLTVNALHKQFGAEVVLTDLDLHLAPRETLSVLGRSGSGKTTLLKIIAGLETADTGQVCLKNEQINDWSPQRRGIIYLYQEALLFPHLNVFENVAFGLRLRRVSESAVRERVTQLLAELELSEQTTKGPDQLSGGQRQRVAFGRALILQPEILLLDEPFGALDAQTRQSMQVFFRRIAQQYQLTALFVTHDLKEALTVGDRLGVMEAGRLKLYPDHRAFIADASTGVQEEITFWKNLQADENGL